MGAAAVMAVGVDVDVADTNICRCLQCQIPEKQDSEGNSNKGPE